MNILDKFFGKEDNQKIIDKSPCLAPWSFGKDNPKLIKDDKALHWKAIGSNGITSLTDEDGNCYALLSMACYILPANGCKSFLIWDRSLDKTIGLQPIKICYYKCDKLQPIVERDKTISKMD